MSFSNMLSVEIPADVITDIWAHFEAMQEKLTPYLVALNNKQRKSLQKMGDKTQAFVEVAGTYYISNPEFAPRFASPEEMHKDLILVKEMRRMLHTAKILTSNLDDTVLLAGSEAYRGARNYYNTVKMAANEGNLSAKPIAEKLAETYPGRKAKNKIKDS